MKNFWAELPRPFFALAPMADVTDGAFRQIIAKYGGPDVMWTEFVSADGLCHSKGREKLLTDLIYSENERPIVAQLFTAHPDKMFVAAKFIAELGFDGLDINMGCPDRKVEKQDAGAALMKNPKLAREIIAAAKEGVAHKLPVSVKTRLGYARDEIETWFPALIEAGIAAVTIHARTRKEMSKVPAHWEAITRAVAIRNQLKSGTLIIGNGDTSSLEVARARATETGADGIMLGRAVFGNPWLFSELNPRTHLKGAQGESLRSSRGSRDQSHFGFPASKIKGDTFDPQGVALREHLRVLVEHTQLFEKLLGEIKSFAIMKKHFKAYLSGFSDTSELRQKLMAASDANTVAQIVDKFISSVIT